jgi:hypothetical protein
MLSGLLLIVAGAAIGRQSVGSRVLSIVVGVAFFAYGFYLEFIFQGDSYRIFFYAFIVPVLVIYRVIQSRRSSAQQATAAPAAYSVPQGQPVPQSQPGPQDLAVPQAQPAGQVPQAQPGDQAL